MSTRFFTSSLLTLLIPFMALAGPGRTDYTYPVTGSPKALIILVEFDGLSFNMKDAHDYFSGMLNEEGFSEYFGKGSCKDYFRDNSLGLFMPQFDLFGPVKLSKSFSYYGQNVNNVIDPHAYEMVVEACKLLDDEIDFSQYDTNGDGVVDNIFVFYAGNGEASGGSADTVWPHSAYITQKTSTAQILDGVKLDRYACANEWEKNLPTGIGTFCHEFTHVLGIPDIYATDYSTAFTPKKWDLMDIGSTNNNQRVPCYMTAFERYALGWLEPGTLEIDKEYTLEPISQNKAYIITTDNPNEYFLLENRQKLGWDKYLPGHGMLLWHIDYNKDRWAANTVNNDADHQYVDIVEADGLANEATVEGDTFPGSKNVTTLSRGTNPGFQTWSGESLGIILEDITEQPDGTITFRVVKDESGVEALTAKGFTIYGLTIDTEEDIKVFDIAGRLVLQGRGQLQLPAEGIYIIHNSRGAQKIMIK